MDSPQQTVPSESTPHDPLQFAPPPPQSGAGQNQAVPLEDIRVSAPQRKTPSPQPQQYFQSTSSETYPPPAGQVVPDIQGDSFSGETANVSPITNISQDQAPPLPQRPIPRPPQAGSEDPRIPVYDPSTYPKNPEPLPASAFPPPPQRHRQIFPTDDDPSNPTHYTRDPHKLIAYLVPFPKPHLKNLDESKQPIPIRFLIYTPAPPPLSKPVEGTKEAKLHKVQRKWQEEVRSAKTSTAKPVSWQGVKSKATRGVSKAMNYTTTSNLDFLGRVSDNNKSDSSDNETSRRDRPTTPTHDLYPDDPSSFPPPPKSPSSTSHHPPSAPKIDKMILIHPPPPTVTLSPIELRTEFVNTMLRTKSKAMRDSVIATGLLPVTYGIDILATFVWPFGGLGEIDTVWAYSSIRGAKTARSVTKRLGSDEKTTSEGETQVQNEKDRLKLTFTPSPRVEILTRYLNAECHKVDSKMFPGYQSPPLESDVLEAIGWSPHQNGGEVRNWEEEQWETSEVKDDLKVVMHKAAKEWRKWCGRFEEDPEKAMKK